MTEADLCISDIAYLMHGIGAFSSFTAPKAKSTLLNMARSKASLLGLRG